MNRSIVILILCFSCATFVGGQNRARILVSPDKTVESDIVRLSDIAEIAGAAETSAKLKSVSLGYAPNVGALRELTRSQIALAISAAGFTDGDVDLEMPAKIVLRRAAQTVSSEKLRQKIEEMLAEKLAGERIEFQIKRLETPENILAPAGAIEIRPNFSSVQNFFLPFSLSLEIAVGGKIWRRVPATIEIEAFADVLTAARDLTAKDKPTEADFTLAKRKITRPLANYFRDASKLRGFALVKPLAAGAELTVDAFVSTTVIKAGDPVRIEAQSGKLKIQVAGEARASGRIGDRIAVKNLQSGAVLQATIIDEGLVRINF